MTLSACPPLSATAPDMSVRPPPFRGADKRTDTAPDSRTNHTETEATRK